MFCRGSRRCLQTMKITSTAWRRYQEAGQRSKRSKQTSTVCHDGVTRAGVCSTISVCPLHRWQQASYFSQADIEITAALKKKEKKKGNCSDWKCGDDFNKEISQFVCRHVCWFWAAVETRGWWWWGEGGVCSISVHIHFNIFLHRSSPRSDVFSGLDWSGFLGWGGWAETKSCQVWR